MNLFCLLGLHRRSVHAMARKQGVTISICEHCARPMVKHESGRWVAAEPL